MMFEDFMLTEEELNDLCYRASFNEGVDLPDMVRDWQALKMIEGIVRWLDEPCHDHIHVQPPAYIPLRRQCQQCLNELRKAAEG